MSSNHLQSCLSASTVNYILNEIKKENNKKVIIENCIDPLLNHVLFKLKPYILYTCIVFGSTIVLLAICLIYFIMNNNIMRN